MNRLIVTAAGALLLLAGCSSGGDDTTTPNETTPPATESASPTPSEAPTPTESESATSEAPAAGGEIDSVAAAEQALDCTEFTVDTPEERELFVADSGRCTLANGNTVLIKQFGTDEALTNYFEIAKEFGWTLDTSAAAGLVVVIPEVPSDLAEVRAALGQG